MIKNLLVLGVIALVGWAAISFFGASDERSVDSSVFESLAKRQTASETLQTNQQIQDATDLAKLASQGKGQTLPPHLISRLDATGDYWFVGKPGADSGVEIPFAPGTIAKSPVGKVLGDDVLGDDDVGDDDDEDKESQTASTRNPGYLGAAACKACHPKVFETFQQTAHHKTSRLATLENISGDFSPDQNRQTTRDRDVSIEMIQRDKKAYQRVHFYDWSFEVPFDLIFGSSKMAETYLYWHGSGLYQLNTTYLSTVDQWINSPGYLDGDAAYARPIPSGCVDCHTTYVDFLASPNHYAPDSMILGVSCERCHGPGQKHVQFHQEHPEAKQSAHLVVPTRLSRERELDVCGQCHTGKKLLIDEQAFQFRPGDSLDDHYRPLPGQANANNTVHASNQVARLAMSKCFEGSQMGCVDCHNPHHNERGKIGLFSQRCLACHETEHCGVVQREGPELASNCIDCHMPKTKTGNLRLQTAEGDVFPPLRDHYIQIDQAATESFLQAAKRTGEPSRQTPAAQTGGD